MTLAVQILAIRVGLITTLLALGLICLGIALDSPQWVNIAWSTAGVLLIAVTAPLDNRLADRQREAGR